MSGYRGGVFKCPFYSRDYRDHLNCEGAQLRLEKKSLDEYTRQYCADAWRACTVAQELMRSYEREKKDEI